MSGDNVTIQAIVRRVQLPIGEPFSVSTRKNFQRFGRRLYPVNIFSLLCPKPGGISNTGRSDFLRLFTSKQSTNARGGDDSSDSPS